MNTNKVGIFSSIGSAFSSVAVGGFVSLWFGVPFFIFLGFKKLCLDVLYIPEKESVYVTIFLMVILFILITLFVAIAKAIKQYNEQTQKKAKLYQEMTNKTNEEIEQKEKDFFQCQEQQKKGFFQRRKERELEFFRYQKEKESEIRQYRNKLERYEKLVNDTPPSFPWLAKLFSELEYIEDKEKAIALRTKKRPALKAADVVSSTIREKRDLQLKCKMYEYQLNYYENLFPELEEFKEVTDESTADIIKESQNKDDELINFLSLKEYNTLSSQEKLQLALDRYQTKQKSKWKIGRDFERYIGYIYEKKGYSVQYHGALFGLEDRGRDLIVTTDTEKLVIQCKRWAKEKVIHEKHIFQLHGSVVMLNIENKTHEYKGLFITTAQLSEVAKKYAEYLNIQVMENVPVQDYPMIKCNIAKNQEKIYHLPFDQQYDTVQVEPSKGECYVKTIKEAEKLGFRHAYRWIGNEKAPPA